MAVAGEKMTLRSNKGENLEQSTIIEEKTDTVRLVPVENKKQDGDTALIDFKTDGGNDSQGPFFSGEDYFASSDKESMASEEINHSLDDIKVSEVEDHVIDPTFQTKKDDILSELGAMFQTQSNQFQTNFHQIKVNMQEVNSNFNSKINVIQDNIGGLSNMVENIVPIIKETHVRSLKNEENLIKLEQNLRVTMDDVLRIKTSSEQGYPLHEQKFSDYEEELNSLKKHIEVLENHVRELKIDKAVQKYNSDQDYNNRDNYNNRRHDNDKYYSTNYNRYNSDWYGNNYNQNRYRRNNHQRNYRYNNNRQNYRGTYYKNNSNHDTQNSCTKNETQNPHPENNDQNNHDTEPKQLLVQAIQVENKKPESDPATTKKVRPPIINASIEGIEFQIKIDTGANVSCVNKNLLNRILEKNKEIKIEETSESVHMAVNGKAITSNGMVILPIKIGNMIFNHKAITITNLVQDFLLGWDFFARFQCGLNFGESQMECSTSGGMQIINFEEDTGKRRWQINSITVKPVPQPVPKPQLNTILVTKEETKMENRQLNTIVMKHEEPEPVSIVKPAIHNTPIKKIKESEAKPDKNLKKKEAQNLGMLWDLEERARNQFLIMHNQKEELKKKATTWAELVQEVNEEKPAEGDVVKSNYVTRSKSKKATC